jgi:pyruvate/2-oxoacid:ferredoxin oxidoreductase beta subunit
MSTLSVTSPVEPFLRSDRMPHIWCPGSGIGTTVNCFARALIESKIDLQSLALVSAIGCTGHHHRSTRRTELPPTPEALPSSPPTALLPPRPVQ